MSDRSLAKDSAGTAEPFQEIAVGTFVGLCRDRRGLEPPYDVQGHGLVRVASEAADFEIEAASVERLTERR